MKIIKSQLLLLFFIIISSCNEYMGTIEENYEPTKTISEIFIKDNTYKEIENISISKIIYPISITEDDFLNFKDIIKVQSIQKNTRITFLDNKYYLYSENTISVFNFDENKIKIKIDLKKDEKIISLFEYNTEIYFLTNNSKLFKLIDETYELISDYEIFISANPIIMDDVIILFSAFGEVIEINLKDNNASNKGSFLINYGILDNYKSIKTNDSIFYLYNSGTLLTIDKNSYLIKNNYYLEDLNILSNIGNFSDLLDTPFYHNDFFYFIDRSGLISTFNPINSNILWEIDISNSIVDYLFSINAYLILLTFDDVMIYNENGELIKIFKHNVENPISLFGINEEIHIISEKGINSFNINSKTQINFFKNKFTTEIDLHLNNSNIYLKDDKHIFILE